MPVLPPELVDGSITYHINPTGKFVIGGPHGDSGVTGRKIIVDTYGGMGRHGGGAFSGKDPTKVDRSAAYMARYVAKNVVASGLAERCEIQLAYAIGVSEPVSVHVDTQGTGHAPRLADRRAGPPALPADPSGIIKHLDLRRPIYRKTASGGHFGRSEPEFTWEKTDKANLLRDAANTLDRRCRSLARHDPAMSSRCPSSCESLSPEPKRRSPHRFGGEPAVMALAPGRVELLGNHTDYNGGLVIAAAIDRSTVVRRPAPRGPRGPIRVVQFDQGDTFSLDAIEPTEPGTWARYVRGVCWACRSGPGRSRRASRPSSPATSRWVPGSRARRAFRLRVAWFLIQLGLVPGVSRSDFAQERGDLHRMELARSCGDRRTSSSGSARACSTSSRASSAGPAHALFLDCRTLVYDRLPLGQPAPAIVVCDSKTSRRLADGMYDQRRAECERVVAAFRNDFPRRRRVLALVVVAGRSSSRSGTPSTRSAASGPGTS